MSAITRTVRFWRFQLAYLGSETPTISLRKATLDDAHQIFMWRNDIDVRSVSRFSRKVEWEEHAAWLSTRLEPGHAESVWIIQKDATPVGSARIEQYDDDDRSEISIVIEKKQRDHGIGQTAIKQLADVVRSMGRIPVAFVRPDNERSVKAFQKAGFTLSSQPDDACLWQLEAGVRDDRG